MIEIPGYTILRPLGQGGMATVYLAIQQSLGREVALKVLAPALAQDPVSTERFLREARIAAKLHHPHIVAIHDVGVHAGTPYMSIAYEPGGTVARMTRAQLDMKTCIRIVRDIAGALDYAHRQGVAHRDVKPENILLRADGSCVLSDFGIAHAAESQGGLTREGTSVGTPHYMSPEQLRGERTDGRSDLYSLGVLMFQLLTGELPFQGSDGWAIGMQHIMAPVPKFPAAFAHLQDLLDALLAKDPTQRLQSGSEVVRWIDSHITLTPAMTMAMPTPRGAHLTSGGSPVANSIAVLPFADMSAGRDQEYFSDGLAEEILNLLAKVPNLPVAGRTASFSFKGRNANLAEIGRELKVANVLEGSVRKIGERVRISVQLIKIADGFNLWSETYDRQLTDVFAIQEEIATAAVAAIRAKLAPADIGLAPVAPLLSPSPELAAPRSPTPEPAAPMPEPRPFLDSPPTVIRATVATPSEAERAMPPAPAVKSEPVIEAKPAATTAAPAGIAPPIEPTAGTTSTTKAESAPAAAAPSPPEMPATPAPEPKPIPPAPSHADAPSTAANVGSTPAAVPPPRSPPPRVEAPSPPKKSVLPSPPVAPMASPVAAKVTEPAPLAASPAASETPAAAASAETDKTTTTPREPPRAEKNTATPPTPPAAEKATSAPAAMPDKSPGLEASASKPAPTETAPEPKHVQATSPPPATPRAESAGGATPVAPRVDPQPPSPATAKSPAHELAPPPARAVPAKSTESPSTGATGATGEAVPQPVSDLVSAFETRNRSSARPKPASNGSRLLPAVAVGLPVLLLLAWGGWKIFAPGNDPVARCRLLLADAQSALQSGDYARAAGNAKEAEGLCAADQQVQVQALNVLIQDGQAKRQACEASESSAKQLLDQARPAEARTGLEQARAQCAGLATFEGLSQRAVQAMAEANSLVNQARGKLQADKPDEAQPLLERALQLDALVPGSAELLKDAERRRARLARTAATTPSPAPVPLSPAPAAASAAPRTLPPPAPVATRPVATPPAPVEPRPSTPAPTTPPASAPPAPAAPAEPVAAPEPVQPRLVPINTPAPDYPAAARRSRTSGEVVVSFVVRADGSVGDVRIVSARPRGIFERSVQSALRSWRYQPLGQSQTMTRTFKFDP